MDWGYLNLFVAILRNFAHGYVLNIQNKYLIASKLALQNEGGFLKRDKHDTIRSEKTQRSCKNEEEKRYYDTVRLFNGGFQ